MAGALTGLNTAAATAPISAKNPAGTAAQTGATIAYGAPITPTSTGTAPSGANPNQNSDDPLNALTNLRIQNSQTGQQTAPLDWASQLSNAGAGILNPDVSAQPYLTYSGSAPTALQAFIAGKGPSGPAPSGSLANWIAQAEQLTGVDPSQWTADLNTIIQHESGGSPTAVNNWDSNAAAGHPSQGLMQEIPSTYSQYVPASANWGIQNPVSNIAAGIEYILSRYGGINNVPGIVAIGQGRPYVGY